MASEAAKRGFATPDDRTRAVTGSALWAGAGDAVGAISEMTDEPGLQHRLSGASSITAPVAWRRRIGGRSGPELPLPAGTYSDDTQLRLAVGRAIHGAGAFDVEAFAKVELPVWRTYALGAGRGTYAAAANLTRSGVAWSNNFFEAKRGISYFTAGGNGAAMRIQPHVWRSATAGSPGLLRDVLRDALVTHGHPVGFCGAVFHAWCVEHALFRGAIPDPQDWAEMVGRLRQIPDALEADEALRRCWLPRWEDAHRMSISSAVAATIEDALERIAGLEPVVEDPADLAYPKTIAWLGASAPETRGSGLGTAMAAAALAWLHRSGSNEAALLHAASELATDTDSIGTMAGAILGAARPAPLEWPLQDEAYIAEEARRLARIGAGHAEAGFAYPDPIAWEPPASQSEALAEREDGRLVLRGLGPIEPQGERWPAGESVWQWLRLDFGQTVLMKRRSSPTSSALRSGRDPAPAQGGTPRLRP
jgi:ADP-ribosylglycohydrolase